MNAYDRRYLTFIFFIVILNLLILSVVEDFSKFKLEIPLFNSIQQIQTQDIYNCDEDQNLNTSIQRRELKSRGSNYPIVISMPYKINNKNICHGVPKVSTIVMVHTAPKHFTRRIVLRSKMLNATYYSPESIRVVFLLGLVKSEIIQKRIEDESETYGDIVQGYFLDTYRNLTNKGVMGYKWISEHCMNAEFVTKIDDDVYINFFKVFEEMFDLKKKKKFILCNKIGKHRMNIVRNKRSKWYVGDDEFKGIKRYPHTYCSGLVVFISTDLVPMLYQAAIGSPFVWVDDFYLFGILPSKVDGVVHIDLRTRLNFNLMKAVKCYTNYGTKCPHAVVYAAYHGNKGFEKLWTAIVKDRQQSIYGNYYMNLPGFSNPKIKPLSLY